MKKGVMKSLNNTCQHMPTLITTRYYHKVTFILNVYIIFLFVKCYNVPNLSLNAVQGVLPDRWKT